MVHETVSVVIPARNAPFLDHTLASVAVQVDRAALGEVIVVGDAPAQTSFGDLPIKVIRPPQPVTSPVARNLGMQAAGCDWLVFLDADCIVAPDWLNRLLSAAAQGYQVISGGVVFGEGSYWADVHNVSELHAFHSSAPAGPRLFLPSLNLLVRRDVITISGPMDERLRRAQDMEWTARMRRLGYTLWFEPAAAVSHYPLRTPNSLWVDYIETGYISHTVRRRLGFRQPIPRGLDSPFGLRALSPVIAAAATVRIFAAHPALRRYWQAAPGVWFTKLAWCLGAARAAGQAG